MSESVSPGVLLLCDFVQATNACSAFGGFLAYMDRPEAFQEVRTFDGDIWETTQLHRSDPVFGGYMDYMRDDEKSDGIFTSAADRVSPAQVETLKKFFDQAQEKGCPLYRGVISFDSAFLEEQGLAFDTDLDRTRLKEITRESVTILIKNSQLDPNNLQWTAAIHTNTDNVHVHFAIMEEKKIARKYDMLPQKAIDQAKKAVVNKLVGSEASILRSALLRDDLLPTIDRAAAKQGELILELFSKLPADSRWEYSRKSFEPFQKFVNAAIDKLILLDPDVKKSFDTYMKNLDDYTLKLRRYYGDGDRRLWENVKPDRLQEFYSRAGNALLKEVQDVNPVSISDLEKSGKYNFDQICAIREGLEKNLDISCILDPELSGKVCWEGVRLLEVGTSPTDMKRILNSEADPHIMELISWVKESGKDPSILLEHSWSREQAYIVSVALRHGLDMENLSDPEMPVKEMDKELIRLSAAGDTEKNYPNWNPEQFFLDMDKEQHAIVLPTEKSRAATPERSDVAKHTKHPAAMTERPVTAAGFNNSSLREEHQRLQYIISKRPSAGASAETKNVWKEQRRDQSAIVLSKSTMIAKKLNRQHAKHIKDLEKEFEREQSQAQSRA